jgi:hypothetical protein
VTAWTAATIGFASVVMIENISMTRLGARGRFDPPFPKSGHAE